MNPDLTRQYNLPTPVSRSITSILEHYKLDINNPINHNTIHDNNSSNGGNNNQSQSSHIPDLQDLLNIKQDLEALLPLTENRVKDLKKDLSQLDRNVKIRDNGNKIYRNPLNPFTHVSFRTNFG